MSLVSRLDLSQLLRSRTCLAAGVCSRLDLTGSFKKEIKLKKKNTLIVISELAFELLLFCVSGEWWMDDDDKDTTLDLLSYFHIAGGISPLHVGMSLRSALKGTLNGSLSVTLPDESWKSPLIEDKKYN